MRKIPFCQAHPALDLIRFKAYNFFMENIAGKTALVVGGSGGIGAALCSKLADCGTDLIIHGSAESAKFDALAKRLSEKVRVEKIIQHFESGFEASFKKTRLNQTLIRADIICVCFGPFVQKELHRTTAEDWRIAAELNYVLPGMIISSALPAMMQKGWGRFLLMGGTRTDCIRAFKTNAAYAGAKTALATLARSTAVCYARYGITCNLIVPGFTRTEYISESEQKKLAEKMPLHKLVEPEDIAETAVFLLRQPMINGAMLNMDGGWEP